MITASQVKELREKTGAGMMECKKVLTETDGDIEKAMELLRERGITKAAKKASRVAAEGLVGSFISEDGKVGAIAEVNTETDFVAENAEFKQFVNDVMKWKTKKGYHISEAKAKEIYALAQNGIPVLPNTKSTTIIVREAAKLIYELKSTRDTILAQMQAFAKTLPEYSIIRDMSCIGEVLSARIIAEIGDITRYKNKHSLIAYAGIDAPPYQSGKFNATERHISKRGNAYLRKIGYEIMQSLIMHKPDGDPVFDYITKKRAEGKPAKAAMIAGLNKFLRIYYGKVSELYSSLYSYC